jgi:hypothetical protein
MYLEKDFFFSTFSINFGGDHDRVLALLKSFSFSQLPATEKEFMHALKAAMREEGDDTYRNFFKVIYQCSRLTSHRTTE